MRIIDSNWMQIEKYLGADDRCVLPIGSTEQHGFLSLCTDAILAERIASEAAEPLGVPVYPAMPFGCAPYFSAFPGSISLRVETLLAVVRDVIESMHRSGFRRVLIVNGHGGNAAVGNLCRELIASHPEMSLRFHDWWLGPKVRAKASEFAPHPSHANWYENFPWTRLRDVTVPKREKPIAGIAELKESSPARVKQILEDGSFGGAYQQSDETMLTIWQVGVEETREQLERPWANQS